MYRMPEPELARRAKHEADGKRNHGETDQKMQRPRDFVRPQHAEIARQREYHGDLHQLGRLEAGKAEVEPSTRSVAASSRSTAALAAFFILRPPFSPNIRPSK